MTTTLFSPLTIRDLDGAQPALGRADVPVQRGGRGSPGVAPHPPRAVRVGRRGHRLRRGDGRPARGPHLARGHRDLERRAARCVGADRRRDPRPAARSPAIQLAHAGRKASTWSPFSDGRGSVPSAKAAGPPSRPRRSPSRATPSRPPSTSPASTRSSTAFAAAARRAVEAGFEIARDPRRARLPAAPVPLAPVEPAHRRVRRLAREPRAAAAARRRRGSGCRSRRPALRPLLGHRLGRRRLDRRGDRDGRALGGRTRCRLLRHLQRRARRAPADRAVAGLPGRARRARAPGRRRAGQRGRASSTAAVRPRTSCAAATPTRSCRPASGCGIRTSRLRAAGELGADIDYWPKQYVRARRRH